MDSKLTLKLNESVIEQAKLYAQVHHISLSRMIENYLQALINTQNKSAQISPLVKDLTGVIKLDDDEYRKSYTEYLFKKYS